MRRRTATRRAAWQPPRGAALAALALLGALMAAGEPLPVTLADFREDAVDRFPSGWLVKGPLGRLEERASPEWRVRNEDGRSFLAARAEASAVTIGRAVSLDVREHPVLRWTWRALVLPENADETDKSRADSAAGLYVFFEGGPFWNPYALKYVWSTSLPAGARLNSQYSSNTRIIVVRSGTGDLGAWLSERRHLIEDFRERFEDEEPRVKAIGLLTDADDTGSLAVAHYGSIEAVAD